MNRGLLLAAISLLLAATLSGCGPEASNSPEAVERVDDSVSVTGELKSANSHYFGPPSIPDVWNYTIAFMAPDGLVVDPGTVILRFDTQELMTKLRDKKNALNEKQKQLERTEILAREQLAEARLRVEESKANLDKAGLKAEIPETLLASRDYRENQLLLEEASIDYELKQKELQGEIAIQATEVEILKREVSVLEVEVGQLQGSIDSMSVKAPGEGVVIHARDRRMNKLAVGDNVWMGRRVMEFPDLSLLEAHLRIPERESARIKIGQLVRFSLDAAPDQEFLGEIVELASVVQTRSRNQPDKVFDAKVLLSNPDTELMRPGMSINAEIVVSGAQEVSGP